MKDKLKQKTVYTSNYKGVAFEIQNWITPALEGKGYFYPEKEHRTYYLYICLDRIPEKHNPSSFWLDVKKPIEGDINTSFYGRTACYDYYDHPIINEIYFHGGITYYSKETCELHLPKIIKIGCDYGHLHDEHQRYSIVNIEYDVREAIESFRSMIPDYKYWCHGNGKLYDESEGLIRDGEFFSKEYFGDKEWYQEEEKKQSEIISKIE